MNLGAKCGFNFLLTYVTTEIRCALPWLIHYLRNDYGICVSSLTLAWLLEGQQNVLFPKKIFEFSPAGEQRSWGEDSPPRKVRCGLTRLLAWLLCGVVSCPKGDASAVASIAFRLAYSVAALFHGTYRRCITVWADRFLDY